MLLTVVYVWKFIHWPESMVDESDSSHSGMVAGVKRCPRVGLAGAEAAKKGMFKADMDSLAKVSRLKVCIGSLVGDERGGVTGALLEIRRGGSVEGMTFRKNANGCDAAEFGSRRVGLGQEEDKGLGW